MANLGFNINGFGLNSNAQDIGGNNAPKLKHNFTITFAYRAQLSDDTGAISMESCTFPVKQGGRPNPNVDYEKVSYYGYRTDVAKKIDMGTTTIAFYDDAQNKALDLFYNYFTNVSNIIGSDKPKFEAFSDSTIANLDGDISLSPITYIILTHHYNSQGASLSPDKKEYKFINPKIVSCSNDELDHTQADASSIILTFKYDTFVVS